MSDKPACGACRFAALFNSGTVECRRFPPAPAFEPTGKMSNMRPRVGAYYWCGEFQRGPGHDGATFAQHMHIEEARS